MMPQVSDYRSAGMFVGENISILSDEVEETTQPSCALTQFTDWSECSARCGHGNQTRTRKYVQKNGKKYCEVTGSNRISVCLGLTINLTNFSYV